MSEFVPDLKNIKDLKRQMNERLNAAKGLLDMNLYNDSVSRAYYAVFSAISLLFYLEGKSFSSHKGLITNFHKEFIQNDIFPTSFGSTFTKLFHKGISKNLGF